MTLGLPCVFSVMVGDTQIALKKMKQRQSKLRSQIPLRHPTGVNVGQPKHPEMCDSSS